METKIIEEELEAQEPKKQEKKPEEGPRTFKIIFKRDDVFSLKGILIIVALIALIKVLREHYPTFLDEYPMINWLVNLVIEGYEICVALLRTVFRFLCDLVTNFSKAFSNAGENFSSIWEMIKALVAMI